MNNPYFDKGIGYWIAYRDDGTRSTLHRILLEEFLGRELGKSEVAHHINGIKIDNRLENLEAIDRDKHSSLHSKRPVEDIIEFRNCAYCSQEFSVGKRRLRSKKRNSPYIYCSRSCGAKAQWERQRNQIEGHSVLVSEHSL